MQMTLNLHREKKLNKYKLHRLSTIHQIKPLGQNGDRLWVTMCITIQGECTEQGHFIVNKVNTMMRCTSRRDNSLLELKRDPSALSMLIRISGIVSSSLDVVPQVRYRPI